MPNFTKAEEIIRQYFEKDTKFKYNDKDYTVRKSGKPKPQKGKGEPKTDIYVQAESDDDELEIRLSYKMKNADFLENKMGSERAEQIFGPEWESIIGENTSRISELFQEAPLLYRDAKGRTEERSMTLGWRFELFNKEQGNLSGLMKDMTSEQVYEVYAGEKLEERKRDAKVNGEIIPNSGIAEYILVEDEVNSTQEIIDKMVSIEEYVSEHPDVYFGCKALNYRSKSKKIEGNRALSVQVDWHVESDGLEADIEFNSPLTRNGKEMKRIAEQCLKEMNKKDATEISDDEIRGVRVYKK